MMPRRAILGSVDIPFPFLSIVRTRGWHSWRHYSEPLHLDNPTTMAPKAKSTKPQPEPLEQVQECMLR
jgi:hypothetical protein